MILLGLFCLAAPAHATQTDTQRLRVVLDLQSGLLRGHGSIPLPTGLAGNPEVLLRPDMRVLSVRLDGEPVGFAFEGGVLRPDAGPANPGGQSVLDLEYEGRFHNPVPREQFGMDNPGFGVEASVTEEGVFLQGGSGWHPRLIGLDPALDLEIDAPRGVLAVTSGRILGHEDRGDRTISRWRAERAADGLPLSAGKYVQGRLDTPTVPVLTYFFPASQSLAETYLQASARHLAAYEKLHGPYPFDHFAVVENFFPTGYGMPGFTLLGSSVVRLPFIPETSLRHEVAHCWWGNGVLVAPGPGNWSEGLATYVADHLAQEELSAEAAGEYRLRILRDYALLAAGPRDFPVGAFRFRSDPATQVVGYGKSMYILHMIRQRLGDARFWAGLRDFYGRWLFREATWGDMLTAFETAGWDGRERETFERQWLRAPGAPDIALGPVEVSPEGAGFVTSGTVTQKAPFYDLFVTVRVETADGPRETRIFLNGGTAGFSIPSQARPLRLAVDPDRHLFRLLAASEIPPTVNSVKGAGDLLVVVSDDLARIPGGILSGFLASLNQEGARVAAEAEAQALAPRAANLLFFGFPRSAALQALLAPPESYGLTRGPRGFAFPDKPAGAEIDALFLALPNRDSAMGVAAVLQVDPDLDAAAVADAARRITHYGKDSFVGFRQGANRLRGAWPAVDSPLTVEFQP
jgi:hypothetical protein